MCKTQLTSRLCFKSPLLSRLRPKLDVQRNLVNPTSHAVFFQAAKRDANQPAPCKCYNLLCFQGVCSHMSYNLFNVVNASNIFNEDILYPDQQLINFMAVSYPGPHLFLLLIKHENKQTDKVLTQARKLQEFCVLY